MWDRLFTKDGLRGFGLIKEATCTLCKSEDEDVDHLFFTFQYGAYTWERNMLKCGLRNNAPHTLRKFGLFWSKRKWVRKGDESVCVIVATVVVYFIW